MMQFNEQDDAPVKLKTIDELMKLWEEGETCDRDVFAEMKSNLLIMSGKHFAKTSAGLERNLSDLGVDEKKRIRIVKNHTAKAVEDRKTIILSMIPGVLPYPKSETEMRHQKISEIAKEVWRDGKDKNKWREFATRSVDNFEELGEACCKIYFNPIKGGLKGYKQLVKPYMGETPLFTNPSGEITDQPYTIEENEFGQVSLPNSPVRPGTELPMFEDEGGEPTFYNTGKEYPDKGKPVFKGQLMIERIAPYDLKRSKSAKNMYDSPHLQYGKMASKSEIKALIKDSSQLDSDAKEKALSSVTNGTGTTFKIFNGTTGEFQENKDSLLLIETYFRQCPQYPEGYFYIHTTDAILFHGAIPFGEFGDVAFPIKHEANIRFEGSARGFSHIKKVRPQQIEVNRCASAQVEAQLTTGQDKIILQQGGKFGRGADQPGIRVFFANGEYKVIEGRDGGQFVATLEQNIREIYDILQVPDNMNANAQAFDPKAEIFKKQSQKMKFSQSQSKLESYFKEICETYLFLASKYHDEESLEDVIGPEHMKQFGQEFLDFDDTTVAIKLEEVSDDLDSMMVKTFELEMILQYAGKNLSEATLMALLQQFPMLNRHNAFKHINMDYKNVESDMLALERGEYREALKTDKHEVYIEFLTNRMKQRDYADLPDQVKGLFERKRTEHMEFKALIDKEMLRAQQGMIPTGGNLVGVDVYVNEEDGEGNVKQRLQRLKLPQDSIDWLKEKIEEQGLAQERLQEISSEGAQADYLNTVMSGQKFSPPQQLPPTIPSL